MCGGSNCPHCVESLLQAALAECGTDEDCIKKIEQKIEDAEQNIRSYRYRCTLYLQNNDE
jgi:hypothetical protein